MISLVALFMALLFFLPMSANAQSAKDAYKALKKIEAKTQTGISFKEYGPALSDAKVEVNLFSESPEAKEKPRLKEIFNKTMRHYEEAGNVWRYQFAGRGAPLYMVSPDDSAMIKQTLISYPSVRAKIESMEFNDATSYDDFKKGIRQKTYRERLSYSATLKAIWQEASEELKKAGPLLK
jgi:alpha-N-acetylglucosamine transferase